MLKVLSYILCDLHFLREFLSRVPRKAGICDGVL